MRRRIKVEETNRKRIRWKHFMTKVDESEREGRTGKKGSRGRKKQEKEKQKKINTQKKIRVKDGDRGCRGGGREGGRSGGGKEKEIWEIRKWWMGRR